MRVQTLSFLIGLGAAIAAPAFATVTIATLKPSRQSPVTIGTQVTFSATATDTHPNLLTFRFSVAPPGGTFAVIKDFNSGVVNSTVWTSRPFVWVPTSNEGKYLIKVIAKDFVTGESAAKITAFTLSPLVTGSTPVVAHTANPLVALFSAPSCPQGSSMRVSFQLQAGTGPSFSTNWLSCNPPNTMTFEVAGMYPASTYSMFSQVETGQTTVNGTPVTFTTGSLPTKVHFPPFKTVIKPGPHTDGAEDVILHNMIKLGGGRVYPNVATDLSGRIMWYYESPMGDSIALTRPLPNGTFLAEEWGPAWNKFTEELQVLRQVDWAGNILKETNTGILQQELLALGAADAGACDKIAHPAPIGSACLGSFHHDAIQTLPNGNTAVLVDIEKIFPPGTQGDTSGLPVDVIGDMIVVLDSNWQAIWYFDTFEHDSGAPELDLTRPAVLGDTCVNRQGGCEPIFLLGQGIAPAANDWLHLNSLYYWPQTGDIIFSARNQDWILRLNYQDGAGAGNILWRMGLGGDFTIVSTDKYPWFSGQHDVGIEANGEGVMTLFDNGNTRLSSLGLGTNCGPVNCASRGMALTFNETNMQVTPVLSVDLKVFSSAMGSAQLLSNGDYFFVPAIVMPSPDKQNSYNIEVYKTAGSASGKAVFDLQGQTVYRCWQMPDLYHPPTT